MNHVMLRMCTMPSHRTFQPPGALYALPSSASTSTHIKLVLKPRFRCCRFAIWPKVKDFICSLSSGSIVADVGCGNGKYFGVRSDIIVMGSDRSEGLAKVAAKRLLPAGVPGSHFSPGSSLRADVFVADALNLPFRPGSCDAALCIAVLHHISSPTRRLALLSQLLMLLRPGGRAIVRKRLS